MRVLRRTPPQGTRVTLRFARVLPLIDPPPSLLIPLKQGTPPPAFKHNGKTYAIVEVNTSDEKRKFGALYRCIAKLFDRQIARYGPERAISTAIRALKASILTTKIFIGVSAVSSVLLGSAIILNGEIEGPKVNGGAILTHAQEIYADNKFLCMVLVSSAVFLVAYKFIKIALDIVQRLSINRSIHHFSAIQSPFEHSVPPIIQRWREIEDAQRTDMRLLLLGIKRIPVLGSIIAEVVRAYYELKYGPPQVDVLNDLHVHIQSGSGEYTTNKPKI